MALAGFAAPIAVAARSAAGAASRRWRAAVAEKHPNKVRRGERGASALRQGECVRAAFVAAAATARSLLGGDLSFSAFRPAPGGEPTLSAARHAAAMARYEISESLSFRLHAEYGGNRLE